jgi:hypothetical protein
VIVLFRSDLPQRQPRAIEPRMIANGRLEEGRLRPGALRQQSFDVILEGDERRMRRCFLAGRDNARQPAGNTVEHGKQILQGAPLGDGRLKPADIDADALGFNRELSPLNSICAPDNFRSAEDFSHFDYRRPAQGGGNRQVQLIERAHALCPRERRYPAGPQIIGDQDCARFSKPDQTGLTLRILERHDENAPRVGLRLRHRRAAADEGEGDEDSAHHHVPRHATAAGSPAGAGRSTTDMRQPCPPPAARQVSTRVSPGTSKWWSTREIADA